MSLLDCCSDVVGLVGPPAEFLRDDDDPPVHLFVARTCDLTGIIGLPIQLVGSGIGLRREEAMASSIGEALERYANCHTGACETWFGCWADLPDRSPHPSRYALFSDDQHAAGLDYVRFEETTPIEWVGARDLASGAKTWVPAQLVLLNRGLRRGEARIAYPTSSGSAIGRTPGDAASRALFEAVERDAIMRAWHLRFAAPRLIPSSPGAIGLPEEWAPFLAEERCALLDLSSLVNVPTVLAAVFGDWPAQSAIVFGSASGATLAGATRKAALESYHCRAWCKNIIMQRGASSSSAALNDFEDHVFRYSRPEAADACDFLFEKSEAAGLPAVADYASADPNAAFDETVARLAAQDVSCCLVDLTPDDLKQAGLHARYAVCPELCRLSVGEDRPFLGGRRLYRPHDPRLPRAESFRDLNLIPHPFP